MDCLAYVVSRITLRRQYCNALVRGILADFGELSGFRSKSVLDGVLDGVTSSLP